MGFLDIILGLLLLYGLYKGIKNGFLTELASIIALIAGIYGAIHFSYITATYLSERMEWNEHYIKIIAFVITFLGIVLAVHMLGKLLTKVADIAMLGLLNKIAGGIFGVLKVAVLLGAILIFFERANNNYDLVTAETLSSSHLYQPLRDIGQLIFDKVLEPTTIESRD